MTNRERDELVGYLRELERGRLWAALGRMSVRFTERPHWNERESCWYTTAQLGVRHRFEERFVGRTCEELLGKVLAHALHAIVCARQALRGELLYVLPDLGLDLEGKTENEAWEERIVVARRSEPT